MGIEIERKFNVIDDSFKDEAFASDEIAQGYLSSVPSRSVRVRIKGSKGYITIKGESNQSGLSRYEWEKQITSQEARQLLALCEPGMISKTRYYVKNGRHTFEVDVFEGDNTGLTIAEIELGSEDETFEHPHWLGNELTGDKRYYNAYLSKHPYSKWNK